MKRRILQTIAILAGLVSAGAVTIGHNTWFRNNAGEASPTLGAVGTYYLSAYTLGTELPISFGCTVQARAHLADNIIGAQFSTDTMRVRAGVDTFFYNSPGATKTFYRLRGGVRLVIDSLSGGACHSTVGE